MKVRMKKKSFVFVHAFKKKKKIPILYAIETKIFIEINKFLGKYLCLLLSKDFRYNFLIEEIEDAFFYLKAKKENLFLFDSSAILVFHEKYSTQ